MLKRLITNSRNLPLLVICALLLCVSLQAGACVLPTPSISSSGSLTFCEGGSVTLTSSSGAGYSYQWKKNGSNISNATDVSYVVTEAGSYVVEVTLDTCVQTSNPVVITVNSVPNGTLSANMSTICQGQQVTLTAGGGVSYNWSAPGANGNKLTVNPGTTTTYSVTISNSVGCNDVDDITITVKPLPQANISAAGSTTLCDGNSLNLNASSGTGYTYQWCINSQPIPGATNQQLTVSTPGNYQVITTLNGCSRESIPTVITVNPLPTPTITAPDTTCAGDSITLQAAGGVSYQWNSGGPATANYTVAPTSTKTYTVTATNSFGCTQTASATINVKPLPNANISTSGSLILCSGNSVNLNASTGTGYSYQWFKNSSVINGQTAATLNVDAAGSYHVVVTLDGCSKTSALQNITVNPLPTPSVSPGVTICAGDSTTLTASGGTGYAWSNGGPATATYTVAPTSTKTYTVTVSNTFGCTASTSVVITVTPLPQAWLSASGSTVLCDGDSRNLNTANTAGYSYKWHRNDMVINDATSSTYSASLAGNYYVVNTASGCTDTSSIITITVNPLPVVTVSNDTTICSGDSVTLTATGGTTYNWNTGFTGPVYTVSTTSNRTYVVTISDANTCAVAKSITVSTIALPNASISLNGPATFCADRTLTMTASSGTGYAYQWSKDSATISGATNNVLIASQTGSYEVLVTANGCFRKSNPVNVTVNPLPVPVASPDVTICSADTTQLSASGGTGYEWFNGSTSSTINVSPTNTTTYGVTVENSFGCTASESVVVSTIARPTATVNPMGSAAACAGDTATLTASAGTGYSYQWLKNGNFLNGQTAATYHATTQGNYGVIVTANGCPKTSNTVAVTINPLPVATVSNDTTVCSGSPVMLTANGGNTYKWSTGSTSQTISVTPSGPITYVVTVTSAQNCSNTTDVFVSVIPSPSANVTLSGSATLCQGDTLTLTSSSGPGYAYQWRKDGVDLNGETTATYYAHIPGAYSVSVSSLGCSKTSSPVNVVVNPLPVASASNDTTVCQGVTVEMIAFGGTSYRWSNGRFTQTNSVFPNNTSTYTVTVTDGNGCTDTEQVTVNILPLPNANITSSGSLNLCSGQTVTLNASNNTGYTHQWRKDGIPIPGATSSSYLAGETGAFSAIVMLNGCSKTSNGVQVNVNPSLVATSSNDTTICAGDTVMLFAAGGASYSWSTGDTTSTIISAPVNNKTYTVTVSNGTTCTDVETIVVSVKQLPNAFINVSGGVSSICTGQTVMLNANNGAGLSYQWYKDSSAIAGADSSKYLVSDSGSYTLEVTLNGCSRLSAPKEIGVNPLPVVQLSNDTAVCSQAPVTLIVSGGVSYVWNTFATDSVYKITTSSTKTYSVTVTNSFGCKASDQVVVTTLPLPTNVTISMTTSATICEGTTVRMNVGATNGTEFQWQKDGSDIPGADSSSYDAGETGDYAIVVTGSGCSKTSSAQHVTVKPTPETPEIIRVGEDSLVSSVAGGNYKWFRDGTTFSVGQQGVKVTKAGAYRVYVSVDNCPSDTSEVYYFAFTGIEENASSGLVIYPNPSEGNFTLILPESLMNEFNTIRLFNTVGQIVWETTTVPGNKKINIDLTHLPHGVYHLHAPGVTQKVVVAK